MTTRRNGRVIQEKLDKQLGGISLARSYSNSLTNESSVLEKEANALGKKR